MKYCISLLPLLVSLAFCPPSNADALVFNKAMQASSIAEFFIDEKGVTVELEIGLDSLEGFKSLLPDGVYQNMGFGQSPLVERLDHFFDEKMVLKDQDGNKLVGHLLHIEPSTKVLRDAVTGAPLAIQEDAPDIITALLRYDFGAPGRPDELTFYSAVSRDLGFVVYHNEVAVNDFRYLSSGLRLQLDWEDAWYSRFSTRSMLRKYFAPMSGFIYVEPFEVRKEIIVRPKDLQRWVNLGLEGHKEISVDEQGHIKQKVAEFLTDHQPVIIDGRPEQGILESVNFLERTLTSSRVIDPPEPLNIDSAIIGVIFIYPRSGVLPEKVVMDWDLWDERIVRVPVSAVDQAGAMPGFVEPDWRQLVWENFLKHPDIPTLKIIRPPAKKWQTLLHNSRIPLTVLLVVSLMILGYRVWRRQSLTLAAIVFGSLIIANTVSYTLGESNEPGEEYARRLVADLLHNVYRAFDYRAESDVYDVLDQSVTGDLLTDIYLETKRSLVLVSQGGSQAKVKEVILDSVELKPVDGDNRFSVEASWVVNGSVGHWGHIHQRSNHYRAMLTIVAVGLQWKLEEMTVLQEERL